MRLAKGILAAVAIGLCIIGVACRAYDIALPDPRFTPGEVVSDDTEIACAHAHTPRLYELDREAYWDQAHYVFELYGIPWAQHRQYELDHFVPRCIGGKDTVANLWPEPLDQAKIKNEREREICRAVCTLHEMSIKDGQHYFLSNGWAK